MLFVNFEVVQYIISKVITLVLNKHFMVPGYYCNVFCSFRPRNRGQKSYTCDSHGFELEKNYFQGKL